jgi:hypothetical protein
LALSKRFSPDLSPRGEGKTVETRRAAVRAAPLPQGRGKDWVAQRPFAQRDPLPLGRGKDYPCDPLKILPKNPGRGLRSEESEYNSRGALFVGDTLNVSP